MGSMHLAPNGLQCAGRQAGMQVGRQTPELTNSGFAQVPMCAGQQAVDSPDDRWLTPCTAQH